MVADAELIGYSFAVHSTPYDIQQTSSVASNTSGTLSTYAWLSTDGNISDLSDCFVHEYVIYYEGTPNPYIVPAPFVEPKTPIPNPTLNGNPGSDGGFTDNNHFLGTAAPYHLQSFYGTKHFEYDDLTFNTTNIDIPGTPTYKITRSVYLDNNSNWWESASNGAVTAYQQQTGS